MDRSRAYKFTRTAPAYSGAVIDDVINWVRRREYLLPSFSGRCCPTVEHSAAERHVGVVNICFRETFEDPPISSVILFLNLLCSDFVISDTIIDLFFTYLL